MVLRFQFCDDIEDMKRRARRQKLKWIDFPENNILHIPIYPKDCNPDDLHMIDSDGNILTLYSNVDHAFATMGNKWPEL